MSENKCIVQLDDLRKPSEPLQFLMPDGSINREEGDEIIAKLSELFDRTPELIAAAAPQLGIFKRIFGIRFDNEVRFFIDPIITKKAKFSIAAETSNLLPGKEILIGRPEEVTAVYYTKAYKYEENKFLGPAAKLIDQYVQLLDGILPDELGLISDPESDGSLADLSEDEMLELFELYRQFSSVKAKRIRADISEDEELRKLYNQLEFSEKVVNGKAAVVAGDGADIKRRGQAKAALAIKKLSNTHKAENQAKLKKFLNNKRK